MVFVRELKLDYVPGSEPVEYNPEEGLAPPDVSDMNRVELCGFVCKEPVYRKTPFDREIADLLIAVNRSYSKSDYIPCIAWGRSARFCSKLIVGDKVRIIGRIQSRVYQKKHTDGTVEEKVAYELSVIRLELLRDYKNARRTKFEAMRQTEQDAVETEYSSERKVDIF
jgi:single-stranded DNA-binding protein